MPDNLMPWHKTFLMDPDYDRVDLVGEGANSQAFIKLMKNRGGSTMDLEKILAGLKPEHREVVEKAMKKKDDDLNAAKQEAADSKAKADKAEEDIEKMKSAAAAAPVGTPTEEDIIKSITDPGMKAFMEVQFAKTKAAEAEVRKMREREEEQVAVAKAKEVPNLGAEEAVLASISKKLTALSPELHDEVFGIFKSVDNMLADGGSEIFKSKGNGATNGAATSNDEAWAKIEDIAKGIKTRDGGTMEAAVSKAISENPELYRQYTRSI